MGWECSCGESTWECGESGWKCEIVVNHGGDAGNPCGILSIAVAMTYDSNENNKFKEWRE